jgi:hypothetical protein
MTAKRTNEAMPCPRCGAMHQCVEYGPRPDLKTDDRDGSHYPRILLVGSDCTRCPRFKVPSMIR